MVIVLKTTLHGFLAWFFRSRCPLIFNWSRNVSWIRRRAKREGAVVGQGEPVRQRLPYGRYRKSAWAPTLVHINVACTFRAKNEICLHNVHSQEQRGPLWVPCAVKEARQTWRDLNYTYLILGSAALSEPPLCHIRRPIPDHA